MLKTILVAVALSVIFTLTACFGGSSSSDATACAESASLSQSLNVSVVGDGYFVLAGGLGLTYRRSGILSIDDNGFIVVGENAQRLQGSPALSSGGFATGTLTEMTVTDANIGSSQLEINELGLLYALVDDKPLAFGQLVLTIFYNPEELFEIGPDGEEFAETFGAGYPTTAAADTEGYGPICISRHTPPESEPSPTPGEQLLSGNLTLSLWGLGYFIVDRNGQQGLMRTGTFGIDGDGRVATAEGWVLQGHSAINGVFQREVITDLIVTEHGVDLSTIDISKFAGVFFAAESEVVLGQLLLAN
ncbi:MAG: hypothetical protein HRU20_24005, partial [Pseudomonadales bacterium]|nr:hypothetical protein [Pseudomonadales bacterium]